MGVARPRPESASARRRDAGANRAFGRVHASCIKSCGRTGGKHRRSSDGEEHTQDGKEGTPENRREGQTLPLRRVPQEKPTACQDSRPLVLPELPEPRRPLCIGGWQTMTTLLLLAVFLVAGLAVHTLLLWGLARLFRLERATFLRALLIVVLLSVLSIGILAGVRVLGTMPAAMTLVISACQLAITLLCFWGMARLILHASAGKAALVTICHLAVAAIL